ncbi:MAG TPA: alkaline phosphatase family protein, partial [Lentisphaeria bacterium]|nr:alkaline phosphatase family protein [Lentisphaeria bacterium]
AQAVHNIDHPRAGELVLVAAPGAWFAYPWWREKRQAPDYATHVDIHNKPGYDPCELFFGPFLGTSQNHARIRGSHGRIDSNAVYGTNVELRLKELGTLVDLAAALGEVLDA